MILATLKDLKAWLASHQSKDARRANRKLYREAQRAVHGSLGPQNRVMLPHNIASERSLKRLDRQLMRAGGVESAVEVGTHPRRGQQFFLLADGTKVLKDLTGKTITTIPPQ